MMKSVDKKCSRIMEGGIVLTQMSNTLVHATHILLASYRTPPRPGGRGSICQYILGCFCLLAQRSGLSLTVGGQRKAYIPHYRRAGSLGLAPVTQNQYLTADLSRWNLPVQPVDNMYG